MRELARIDREYAKTGDIDILPARIEGSKELATQAYGRDNAWSSFAGLVDAVVGVYALYPECTDKELEELFKWLGFEIVEG